MDVGTTPLIDAVRDGNFCAVEELVENGASVNEAKNDGATPLSISVQEHHTAITAYLLDKKAKVNIVDEGGWSPLFVATLKGYPTEVRLLLDHRANIDDVCFEQKWTALSVAAYNGDLAVAKVLVEEGADTKIGMSPLAAAAEKGNLEMVNFLLIKNVAMDKWDVAGRTPLITAIKKEHLSVVKTLVNHGASINIRDATGNHPIAAALDTRNIRMVKLLIAAGASLCMVDKQPDETEIAKMVNESKTASEEAEKGNLSFFTDAIERGLLPAPHRQWFKHVRKDLTEWIQNYRGDECACYAVFHQGTAGGTIHRIREFDDLRRRVTGYLVAPLKMRECMFSLSGQGRDDWGTILHSES